MRRVKEGRGEKGAAALARQDSTDSVASAPEKLMKEGGVGAARGSGKTRRERVGAGAAAAAAAGSGEWSRGTTSVCVQYLWGRGGAGRDEVS